MNDHIQRIRTIQRKNEMIGIFTVEKFIEPLPACANDFRGLSGLGIRTAPGGGPDILGIMDHRLKHLGRLGKTRRGIIAINPLVKISGHGTIPPAAKIPAADIKAYSTYAIIEA
jgi:hypothetical protein